MDNIIKDSGQGLDEMQISQIEECFNKSTPWIVIKETRGEIDPDKAEVTIFFSKEEEGYYRFLEMSESTQFKLYEELRPLGTLIMLGYPHNDSDPLRKISFHLPLIQVDDMLVQINEILNKYFPYKP